MESQKVKSIISNGYFTEMIKVMGKILSKLNQIGTFLLKFCYFCIPAGIKLKTRVSGSFGYWNIVKIGHRVASGSNFFGRVVR